MIELYSHDYSAGTIVRCLLEEISVPYRLVDAGTRDGVAYPDGYRDLNPSGTVPTLVDGTLVLWETVAILLHLVDGNPAAGLAPALGSPERSVLYRWLGWTSNELMGSFYRWFKADEMVEAGAVEALKRGARADLERHGDYLEAELTARPYLLGEGYTVADTFLAGLCAWSRETPELWFGGPNLAGYVVRVESRPAVQRVYAAEGVPFAG